MRKIKFRGWDKQDKRMIVHEQDFIPLKVTNLGVLRLNPCIKDNNWEFVEVDRFELMQYTGLKDCNDVEVYEGDIVENFLTDRFEIKYIEDKARFSIGEDNINKTIVKTEKIKVIGNIYENPELLEV